MKTQMNFFKNNNNKFDVVHFNAFDLINIQTIILVKIFNAGKIIVHAHNADFTNYKLINKIRHKINMVITDIIADEFIACSEKAAEFMFVKKRLDNKKYKVIYNSIPLQKFKYNTTKRKKIRKKINLQIIWLLAMWQH